MSLKMRKFKRSAIRFIKPATAGKFCECDSFTYHFLKLEFSFQLASKQINPISWGRYAFSKRSKNYHETQEATFQVFCLNVFAGCLCFLVLETFKAKVLLTIVMIYEITFPNQLQGSDFLCFSRHELITLTLNLLIIFPSKVWRKSQTITHIA